MQLNKPPAGYSGTPLVKKLGIRSGMAIAFLNAPDYYPELLGEQFVHSTDLDDAASGLDFIHYFALSTAQLGQDFARLKGALGHTGTLWISWPKRSSGVPTDISESTVRDLGLETGLVDVKACAIDATWSGLKFVYRLTDRPK